MSGHHLADPPGVDPAIDLKLKDREELDIDLGLLYALLSTPIYRHGARSLEKIVVSLVSRRDNGRLHRAALPPDSTLDRETDAALFRSWLEQSRFKNYPDIEKLASRVPVMIAGTGATPDVARHTQTRVLDQDPVSAAQTIDRDHPAPR